MLRRHEVLKIQYVLHADAAAAGDDGGGVADADRGDVVSGVDVVIDGDEAAGGLADFVSIQVDCFVAVPVAGAVVAADAA